MDVFGCQNPPISLPRERLLVKSCALQCLGKENSKSLTSFTWLESRQSGGWPGKENATPPWQRQVMWLELNQRSWKSTPKIDTCGSFGEIKSIAPLMSVPQFIPFKWTKATIFLLYLLLFQSQQQRLIDFREIRKLALMLVMDRHVHHGNHLSSYRSKALMKKKNRWSCVLLVAKWKLIDTIN